MDVPALIEQLGSDGERVTSLCGTTDPHASVPTCPGWGFRDLVHHLGGVHRWAATFVRGDGGQPRADDPRASVLRALLDVLDTMAQERGVSRTVLSLAWLLRHPAGIIPLVGSIRPERIRDAVRADSLVLSREEWYTILVAARGHGLP